MTKTNIRKILSVILALFIVAAMTVSFASCGKNADTKDTTAAKEDEKAPTAEDNAEGAKTITVDVVDDKGETTTFTIKTDEEFLEGALLQDGLVSGSDSEYGLLIDTVNGLRADYNLDGAYWAMYQDGEYLTTGASTTPISDGDHYELVYTKA